jgi:hypothetical protein
MKLINSLNHRYFDSRFHLKHNKKQKQQQQKFLKQLTCNHGPIVLATLKQSRRDTESRYSILSHNTNSLDCMLLIPFPELKTSNCAVYHAQATNGPFCCRHKFGLTPVTHSVAPKWFANVLKGKKRCVRVVIRKTWTYSKFYIQYYILGCVESESRAKWLW